MKKEKSNVSATLLMVLSLLLFAGDLISKDKYSSDLPSGLSAYSNSVNNENINEATQPEKNYLIPAIEVVGLNLFVGAFNTYVTKEDFAKISWKTIENNFKTGFVWDEDDYLTNQFFHPFHGSLYYNSARSNGLEFWEAVPYSLGGSLMWELFMENEPPSHNDLVNTTVSGITMGEISYRVSNLIIDESAVGFERFLREFTSTVINPMQGFNRLIRGDMWKAGSPNKRSDFNFVFSTGVHNLFFSKNINDSKTYLTLRADLNYGNIFDVSKHKKPFDYFSLHTEFNIAEGDDIIGIFASGVLVDNKIYLFENTDNIFGLYKEIDILINETYQLSATSLTAKIINRVPLSTSIKMQNNLNVSAIVMGATNSQYAAEEGKEYNLGPGASGSIGIRFIFDDLGEVYSNYKRYWVHTLAGAEGNEFVGLLNTGINLQLSRKTALGMEFLLYERYGDYEYYENYSSSNSALRFYVKHSI